MAIKREIHDQSFQFRVFLVQLSELPQFAYAQPCVFPFQRVERLLGISDLPADFYDGRAALCLPQRGQNLPFGMPSSLCHRRILLGVKKTTPRAVSSSSPWPTFPVLGEREMRRRKL